MSETAPTQPLAGATSPPDFPNEADVVARQHAFNDFAALKTLNQPTAMGLNLEGVDISKHKRNLAFDNCRGVTVRALESPSDFSLTFKNCDITVIGNDQHPTSSVPRLTATGGTIRVGTTENSNSIPTPHLFIAATFQGCTFEVGGYKCSLQFQGCTLDTCKAQGGQPTYWSLQNQCNLLGDDASVQALFQQLGDTLIFNKVIIKGQTESSIVRETVREWAPQSVELGPGVEVVVPDLSGLSIANSTNLRGSTWRNVHLTYASLKGCDLSEACIDGCTLTHADLTDANLSHSIVRNTAARYTTLTSVTAKSADLSGLEVDSPKIKVKTIRSADGKDGRLLVDADTTLHASLKALVDDKVYVAAATKSPESNPDLAEPAPHPVPRPARTKSSSPKTAPRAPTTPTRKQHINDFGEGSGPLLFPTPMIRALIAAMLTRPMVLLAGISGSGKTQLARRIGAAYAAGLFNGATTVDDVLKELEQSGVLNPAAAGQHHVHEVVREHDLVQNDTYAFTSVRSDWTDATHLWGYLLPTTSPAQFHATGTLRVFLAGQRDTSPTPRFVLLDEMNLARPEHYGSDLLSAMEVISDKEERDGALKPIELHRAGEAVDADPSRKGTTIPATAAWPRGLVVVGTVNVDETTFSFAPKVLDRAAVLEFTHVDLAKAFDAMQERSEPRRAYADAYQRQDIKDWFEGVQAALEPHNLHLAYRAAKECMDVLFVQLGNDPSAWDSNKVKEHRDQLLMSKVLPRVRGPRETVEDVLEDLLKLTAGGEAKVDTRDAVRKALTTATPNSARRKILQMLLRAHDVGFAGFFG